MRAMILEAPGNPLRSVEVPVPEPELEQVLLRVHSCAVCRTDLHVVDGELPDPKLSLIPGHQIVGSVVRSGDLVDRFAAGDRVGVPWLGSTDNTCRYCLTGRENLCDNARFTGYQIDGATPSTPPPTTATASRSRRGIRTCRPRRYCARA